MPEYEPQSEEPLYIQPGSVVEFTFAGRNSLFRRKGPERVTIYFDGSEQSYSKFEECMLMMEQRGGAYTISAPFDGV